MGETNDVAREMIVRATGYVPETVSHGDGTIRLHIGPIELITSDGRLWSEPSAYENGDGSLSVRWADTSVLIPANFKASTAR